MPDSDDNDAPAPWAAGKPAAAAPGTKRPDWRGADAGTPGRGPRAAVASVAFLALAGAAVAWLSYLGRGEPVTLLAIPVSQYQHVTWAANPTADADAARLLRAFGGDKAAVADQERERFRDRLLGLAAWDGGPLVVYVSALTAVRDGRVYVLPAEAKPDDPSDQWVPIDEVLSAVAACPARRKGLWLDAARPAADPFRGPLLDDVADRLDAMLKASPPSFPVLCSCSAGETSLTIPERGASAFAAYLDEGLSGAADGYPPGEMDNKVTFAELAEFVARRVARWADKTRAASQTPAAYGPSGADFVLALRGRPAPAPHTPPAPAYPFADGWAKRDAARVGPARWADPVAVADLEAALLRAEGPFWAGTPGRPAADEIDRLDRRLARARAVPPGPPEATLTDYADGRPAQPGLIDAVALVWQRLAADRDLTAEKVRAAVAALNAGPFRADPPPPTAEVLLLRQLAEAKLPAAAYPEAVGDLLRAEAELSRAAAGPRGGTPGGFARYRDRLDAADRAKRDAERALFAGKTDADFRKAAADVRSAAERLKAVADNADAVRAGRRAWADAADRLRATLPGMVASNVPDARAWHEVAEAAGPVADWFTGGSTDFPRLPEATELLRNRLTWLDKPFEPAAVGAVLTDAGSQGSPKSLASLEALLAGGGLTAPDRATVAAAAAKLSAERERMLRAEYDDKDAAGVAPSPSNRPAPPPPTDRAVRRADAAVALLRLSGHPGTANVEAARTAVRANPSDPAGWQALADELRRAWAVELPKLAAGTWEAADRAARAYPGGLGWAVAPDRAGGLYRQDQDARWDWLTGRYREYGKLRAGFPPAREFYTGLAGEGRPDRRP